MKTLLVASVLIAGLIGTLTAGPLPRAPPPYSAFCRTVWLFATPCAEINTTLVKQIQTFSPALGCDTCQYTLVSASPLGINANHTSPDGLEAENITITLSSTVMAGGCRVSAQSTSLGFTSLLDGGLNYCNLYNLLSASGLSSAPGFMEITSEWACLGYGLATCRV